MIRDDWIQLLRLSGEMLVHWLRASFGTIPVRGISVVHPDMAIPGGVARTSISARESRVLVI